MFADPQLMGGCALTSILAGLCGLPAHQHRIVHHQIIPAQPAIAGETSLDRLFAHHSLGRHRAG